MNFILVDAENIGFQRLNAMNFSTSTGQVIVFSKDSCVKSLCERRFYTLISNYKVGHNQADFFIIGSLMKLISTESKANSNNFYTLISNDKSLILAFTSLCILYKKRFYIKQPANNKSKVK